MPVQSGPAAEELADIPYQSIKPDLAQPRGVFTDEEIQQRAHSIESHGLKNRIKVRRDPDGDGYVLIAGEMRWRAIGILGWDTVPSIIVSGQMSEADVIVDQLVDNMERTDLRPSDEARAYQRLMDLNGWTQKQVADSLNTTTSRISDSLRLLTLPADILVHVDEGRIGRGNATKLAKFDSTAKQKRYAKQLLEGELTSDELAANLRKVIARFSSKRKGPSNTRRLNRWTVPVKRGVKLYLTSDMELEPQVLIGNVFAGLLKLIRQELGEEQAVEMPKLKVETLSELLEVFSQDFELQTALQVKLQEMAPLLLVSLLSLLDHEDRVVRNQAKQAMNEVSGDLKLQFRQIVQAMEEQGGQSEE